MKILWVDDQQNLINSFSALLKSLNPKIISANSGDKALDLLLKNYYDLIICDLMMPPDKWGGLWLIEEIKKHNIKVPILVLSGEGTQTETIRALRLGAQDYVMKEKVDKELLPQVEKIKSEADIIINSTVISSFPLLIALSFNNTFANYGK